MTLKTAGLSLLILLTCCTSAFALYSVIDRGTWPDRWPEEMEPLRESSRTLVGPMVLNRHYAIPFTERDKFESVWPHVLRVRHPESPIFLVRGPNFFLGDDSKAGIVIHSPPAPPKGKSAAKESPIAGIDNPRTRWIKTTYIELVVDDKIIDLDRIELPEGIELIDERKPSEREADSK